MKIFQKYVIGLAGVAMTVGMTGCDDVCRRGVVQAKGNNKIHLTDVSDTSAYYIIDCGCFPAGGRLYRKVAPGDTITGMYNSHNDCIYLTVSPDTVARFVINSGDFRDDCVDTDTPEDNIIKNMVKSRNYKTILNAKTRER